MPTPKPKEATVGFVIDLPNIMKTKKGKNFLAPGAKEAISILQKNRIPFVIVTRRLRIGLVEKEVARDVQELLGLPITKHCVILPHTPFRTSVRRYKDELILVVGGQEARSAALSYGFEHVMTTKEVAKLYPHIYGDPPTPPTRASDGSPNPPWKSCTGEEIKISAVFVWWTSTDWNLDIRIVLDVMMSQAGYIGTHSKTNLGHLKDSPELQPTLHISMAETANRPDRPSPLRKGKDWLRTIEDRWFAETGMGLRYSFCGLGCDGTTLRYADKMLDDLNRATRPFPRTLYMIGRDISFGAQCFKQKMEFDRNVRRRSIHIDQAKAGGVRATLKLEPFKGQWHVAKDLQEAVKHAMAEEYRDCLKKGFKPLFSRP
jgi:hypothetical protein